MKELDELKEKCVQAMKDVDAFVEEHYEDLCMELRKQEGVPYNWEVKVTSNRGVVRGRYRMSSATVWLNYVYDNGIWWSSHNK